MGDKIKEIGQVGGPYSAAQSTGAGSIVQEKTPELIRKSIFRNTNSSYSRGRQGGEKNAEQDQ